MNDLAVEFISDERVDHYGNIPVRIGASCERSISIASYERYRVAECIWDGVCIVQLGQGSTGQRADGRLNDRTTYWFPDDDASWMPTDISSVPSWAVQAVAAFQAKGASMFTSKL